MKKKVEETKTKANKKSKWLTVLDVFLVTCLFFAVYLMGVATSLEIDTGINNYDNSQEIFEIPDGYLTEDMFEDYMDEWEDDLVEAFNYLEDELERVQNVEIVYVEVPVDGMYTHEQVRHAIDDILDVWANTHNDTELEILYDDGIFMILEYSSDGRLMDIEQYTLDELIEVVME